MRRNINTGWHTILYNCMKCFKRCCKQWGSYIDGMHFINVTACDSYRPRRRDALQGNVYKKNECYLLILKAVLSVKLFLLV
jgi:hypothetical protein